MPRSRRSRILAALAAASVAATLAGCSPIVAMEPAPHANAVECAMVTVRLPDTVHGLARRETNAQATGAWGEPTKVLLYCGVEVPGPSELPCFERDGIFWLREDLGDRWAFTTYGRDPAARVLVAKDETVSPGITISELTPSVGTLPRNGRECLDLEDTVTGQ